LSNEFSREIRILRREHEHAGIDVEDLDPNPIVQFEAWLQEAIAAGAHLPNAMTVATVDREGRPSARVTLLKGVDEDGFVFFSNYESRKGQQMSDNGYAALVFYWGDLGRQVRIEGSIEKTTNDESAEYFATRSRGSQIGAWASPQSQVIESREELDAMVATVAARFAGEDVPLPPHWGGFRLHPTMIEFWQGRPSRLHDRICYTPGEDGGWKRSRLAP
jgi:pyridoxamine 5'-phosphate oxidase